MDKKSGRKREQQRIVDDDGEEEAKSIRSEWQKGSEAISRLIAIN